MILPYAIAAAVGYLLGALPFGYLVARARGVNIFEVGSRNPGATNVLRTLGKGPGYTVFALDAAKGALATGWPLWLATLLGLYTGGDNRIPALQLTGLVAALLGHSFSCFTRFKGGKGVATGAGAFLVLLPLPTLLALAIWGLTFLIFRYVSLASLLAAAAVPTSAFLLGSPRLFCWLAVGIASLVILRHRANISRLLQGTESKFVKKEK